MARPPEELLPVMLPEPVEPEPLVDVLELLDAELDALLAEELALLSLDDALALEEEAVEELALDPLTLPAFESEPLPEVSEPPLLAEPPVLLPEPPPEVPGLPLHAAKASTSAKTVVLNMCRMVRSVRK